MTEANERQADEGDMTPDERLEWLRERGVQVETAAERRLAGKTNSDDENAGEDVLGAPISYLIVPADESQPIQEERTFRAARAVLSSSSESAPYLGGDALAYFLHTQPMFAKGRTNVDIGQVSNPTVMGSGNDSNDTLQQVAQEGHVATFTLVHPVSSNDFTGVNIYFDEAGMKKGLPSNKRMDDMAQRAGFDHVQFCGDVVLSRVRRTPSGTEHLSMHIEEDDGGASMLETATWLERAVADNEEYERQLANAKRHSLPHAAGSSSSSAAIVAGYDGEYRPERDGAYEWTQDEEEVKVHVRCVSSMDVDVSFQSQSVTVSAGGSSLLSLYLFERIDVDKCRWEMCEREQEDVKVLVVLTVRKMESALWPRIEN